MTVTKAIKFAAFNPREFFYFLFDLCTRVKYKAPVSRGKAPVALKPENEKVQDNDEIRTLQSCS